MARDICLVPCLPTVRSDNLKLTLPFGTGIQGASNMKLEAGCAGCELLGNLMLQLQPLVGGLGPILCVLGCLGAVINAVKAIPDSLGPPPNPTKLISAIADVVAKCECVVSSALPPPVGVICSFLHMVDDILKILDATITCVLGLIQHLAAMNLRANALLASDNEALRRAGLCLVNQNAALNSIMASKMGPITTLFDALAALFGILGVVPGFSSAIAPLNAALSAFGTSVSSPTLTISEYLTALETLKTDLDAVISAIEPLVQVCPPS